MSLIALTYNNAHPEHPPAIPIMLGDILLSSKKGNNNNIVIPTFLQGASEYLEDTNEWKPMGLVQKLYVISDFTAVALSGNEWQMTTILTSLREFVKYENIRNDLSNKQYLRRERVEDWYRYNLPHEEITELTFCFIYLIDDNKFSIKLHGNWMLGESVLFGDFFAAGSGAPLFVKQGLIFYDKTEVDYNYHWEALKTNMQMLGSFLARERMTADTLSDSWGAGFEIIVFDDRKIKKLDNITFLFIGPMPEDQGPERKFRLLYVHNMKYYGNSLIVTVLDLTTGDAGLFEVPTLEHQEFVEDMPEPEIDSDDVCVVYIPVFEKGMEADVSTFFIPERYSDSDPELPPLIKIEFSLIKDLNIFIADPILQQIWAHVNYD